MTSTSILKVYQLRTYEAERLSFEKASQFLARSRKKDVVLHERQMFSETASQLAASFAKKQIEPSLYACLIDSVCDGANYAFICTPDGKITYGFGLVPAYCSDFHVIDQR